VDPKPTEAEVEALLATAKATRKRPTRNMWLAALVISLACVVGLAYGLITSWDAPPDPRAAKSAAETGSGNRGFGLGLMLGLAAGIAIGSALALRRRDR
jgi:hypothetical protein